MLLLLQKSLKSLQAHVQVFFDDLANGAAPARPLSGGALTHARAKLRASAFTELNDPLDQEALAELQVGARVDRGAVRRDVALDLLRDLRCNLHRGPDALKVLRLQPRPAAQ